MGLFPRTILTAEHTLGVRSAADYRSKQRSTIAKNRGKYPALNWRDPHVVTPNPPVHIDGGRWVVKCSEPECGNYPVVHPEWGLACCLECGAVYEGLTLPEDHVRIAELLLARKALRGWQPGESVADLEVQNARLRTRGLIEDAR